MAFDDENEPGDELEDFGDELSSDYKEEAEEGLGRRGRGDGRGSLLRD